MEAIKLQLIRSICESCNEAQLQDALRQALESLQKRAIQGGVAEQEEEEKEKSLLVLHFNDVYNVESREQEPVGGAARFIRAVRHFQHENPLVLFSGDVLNPSMLSVTTRGAHMIPILNLAGVDAAVFGNHDFDFGLDQLERLSDRCKFPWLASNIKYIPDGNKPIAKGLETCVVPKGGWKVGLIGLVEYEWLATLSAIDGDDIEYEDFVQCTKRLAPALRNIHGVDIVIALTHMRLPNDRRLAREAGSELDLILGGHDHDYCVEEVNKVHIVKSGTDFRDLSAIWLKRRVGENVEIVSMEHIEINSKVPEDSEVAELVSNTLRKIGLNLNRVLGETAVPLDARFAEIRTKETNISNFVADILRNATFADVALINAGTIRLDAIIPKGPVTLANLKGLLPMNDALVVIEITGEQLLVALENGVSKVPALEGRFPCVSGVRFSFDATRPPMRRIENDTVVVNGKKLDLDKKYTVVTKEYLSLGKDGFEVFERGTLVKDEELCPRLPTLVRNHFIALDVIQGINEMRSDISQTFMKAVRKFQTSVHKNDGCAISPEVDGRITQIA